MLGAGFRDFGFNLVALHEEDFNHAVVARARRGLDLHLHQPAFVFGVLDLFKFQLVFRIEGLRFYGVWGSGVRGLDLHLHQPAFVIRGKIFCNFNFVV